MKRRTVLAGGATVVAGLAGCVGGGGNGSESGVTIETDSPTAVVKSWHRLKFRADLEEKKARAANVLHNDSSRLDSIETQETENVADNEMSNLTAEVIEEDLTEDELYAAVDRLISNETLAEVVKGETARVRATYELTTEEGFGGEAEIVHIVATENGEWQILRSIPQR
jgi:hypothetical protein